MLFFLYYLIVFSYISIIIFLIPFLFRKIIKREFLRKISHCLVFGYYLLIECFFYNTIHLVIVGIVTFLATLISYFLNFLTFIEREHKTPGIVYYAFSLLMLLIFNYFFPENSLYSLIAIGVLSFGDPCGYIFYSIFKNKINLELDSYCYKKTYIGSLGVFVGSLIFLLVLKFIIDFNPFLSINFEFSYFSIILLSVFTSIFEVFPFGLDNIAIPLGIYSLCFLL